MALPEVLIVDDDALIRAMLKDALADVPCTIREADSGDAALARVTDSPPAVVLVDLIMPGLSGLELISRITALDVDTKLVVVSGLDSEALVQKALSSGASGYVTKPIHPLDVQALVRSLLERGAASP